MKQMTKEELIEYFIEQLGDNEILGKWMSKDDIFKKLDSIIGDVTYNPEKNGIQGSWRIDINSEKGILNFDLNKITENNKGVVIVHELLHALLTTIYKDNNKRIIKFGLSLYYVDDDNYIENFSIDEGQTDYIAEQITGLSHNGYLLEKDIYKLLSIIIGTDQLLNFAFDNTIEKNFTSYLSDYVLYKYGEELGYEFSNALRKVMKLSDQYTTLQRNDIFFSIDNTNKNIRRTIESEIYNVLRKMFEKIIDNEHGFNKKIDILVSCFPTKLGQDISRKVLGELASSNQYTPNQKLEILHKVKREKMSYIPKSVVKEILFNSPNLDTISTEDRLRYYIELYNDHNLEEYVNTVCELYFETGKISEEIFDKRNAFKELLNNKKNNNRIKTVDDLYKFFESTKYRKIGNYYEIEHEHDSLFPEPIIIESNGNIEKFLMISKDPLGDEKLTRLDRDIISIIDVNVDEMWLKIKELCLTQKGMNNTECQVYIIGKDEIRLQYFDETDETQTLTYILDSEGNLTLAEVGEERRFTDDMSELDIKLQQETADISITEMMGEVENIHKAIEDKIQDTGENLIGENGNGEENSNR